MHDCKGRPLSVGDTVLIPAMITTVSPSPDYCNVSVNVIATMPPNNSKSSMTLNTKQLIRANDGDDVSYTTVVDNDRVTIS